MRPATRRRFLGPTIALCGLLGAGLAEGADTRRHFVDPATTAIGGIRAGMSEREIVTRLGKPASVETGYSEFEDKPSKTVRYEGMRLHFVDGDLQGLSCTGKACRTDRGLMVGDPRSKVLELYGPGNPPYEGAERDTLSYPLRGADVYLVFVFERDRVTALEFFFDYM